MKLVLASNNKGKLAELQALFAPLGVELDREAIRKRAEEPEPHKTFTANGYEIGAKAGMNGFEGVLYAFTAKGLGLSTVGAQFYGGSDGLGNKTASSGYFMQGTYTYNKTKFGINYGQNKDKDGVLGAGEDRKNRAYTLGVYHSLNKFVTLVGELNQEKINASASNYEQKSRTISGGAVLFF